MTVQQVATILGVFGGLVGFGVGLWQYARAQAWKRAEFVAKEIREFESLHPVRVVLRMLDWNERDFELHPDAEDPDERRVVLNDRDIARALAPHADRPDGFGPDEAAVRDYFSVFFDRLERFDHYLLYPSCGGEMRILSFLTEQVPDYEFDQSVPDEFDD